jgi:hypothetical protein
MEQKYNKYFEKLNNYLKGGGKFKIGDEIMLIDGNIPGIVMGIEKYTGFYSIRLVGMNYNINKQEKDISVNTRIDTPEYPFIDGEFNFNYPEFHSFTNVYAPRTHDPRFDKYIIANINGFPSQQFLKFVNTNIFLYHYIFYHFSDILKKSKHVIVDIENKLIKFKSTPLSLAAEEFKPRKNLSADAAVFKPANLIDPEEIGEIVAPAPVPLSSVDSAIHEVVLQSEEEEHQRTTRLKMIEEEKLEKQKILDQAAADTAIQESDEDAYKYALRESILSNYSGERLKHISKLPFERLEKAHLYYQSSLNKPPTYKNQIAKYGQVLNPEEYDTDDEK